MQRIIFVAAILCLALSSAHAAFLNMTLQDSRIQGSNHIYKPAGIIGFAFEGGFFNEPQNIVDYTLAIGVRRFGYSHSDGDKSVSLWEFEFKPLTWSVTYWNVMLEFYLGFGIIFASSNVNEEMQAHLDGTDSRGNHGFIGDTKETSAISYGYRLGYRITEQFMVSLVADYQMPGAGWPTPHDHTDLFFVGGLGLNFQWNMPW